MAQNLFLDHQPLGGGMLLYFASSLNSRHSSGSNKAFLVKTEDWVLDSCLGKLFEPNVS